jgi:hypothetical protein
MNLAHKFEPVFKLVFDVLGVAKGIVRALLEKDDFLVEIGRGVWCR